MHALLVLRPRERMRARRAATEAVEYRAAREAGEVTDGPQPEQAELVA